MRIADKSLLRHATFLLPLNINTFVGGAVLGWVTQAMYKLRDPNSEVTATAEQRELIASLGEIGRVLAALPAGYLVNHVGKRNIIFTVGCLFLSCWITQVHTHSIRNLYVLRILFGFGLGASNTVNAIYIGELAAPELRGVAVSFNTSMYYAGILFEIIIGKYLSFQNIAVVSTIFPLLFVLSSYWLIESPNDLIGRGNEKKANQNLRWLRLGRTPAEINEEFLKLKSYVKNQSKEENLWQALTNSHNRKRLLMVCAIYCYLATCGLPAIFTYMSFLIPATKYFKSNDFPIIFSTMQWISSSLSSFIVDRIERKKFLCVSSLVCSILLSIVAAIYYLDSIGTVSPGESWILFGCISSFACFISGAIGPATMALRSELLPHSIKGVGSSLAVVLNAALTFCFVFAFEPITIHFGIYYNFVIYAAAGIVFSLYSLCVLPETRGKLLADIQTEPDTTSRRKSNISYIMA